MYIKRIKRKCGVRGCKNTDVFALSKSREMGNSVIICKDCLKDALTSTDNYVEPIKVKREVTSLFYHPELANVTLSSVADVAEPKPTEVIEDTITEETHISVAEDTVTIDTIDTIAEPIKAEKKVSTTPKKATNTKKPNNTKKK